MTFNRKFHALCVALAVNGGKAVSVEESSMMRFHNSARDWADSMLQSGEPHKNGFSMSALSQQMPLAYAQSQVEKQHLPADVALVVQQVRDGDVQSRKHTFSTESLAKARNVLNDLAEGSWRELDDHIIDCQEFKERNRESHGQVVNDVDRLVEQITDLERLETEATNGIQQKEIEIQELQTEMKKQQGIYETIKTANKAEMVIRQNDLDVFQFILQFTRCDVWAANVAAATGGSFLQLVQKEKEQLCVCPAHGGHVLHFQNKATQEKYNALMHKSSSHARRVISDVLGGASPSKIAFVQSAPLPTTTAAPPTQTEPVVGDEGFGDIDKMCNCKKTDGCDRLHDEMSLLWGQYKDGVDELKMEMLRNDMMWEEMKTSFVAQIKALVISKTRFMQQLAEVRSNMAADRTEKKEKEMLRLELDSEYGSNMHECSVAIAYDCEKICQYKIVRNAVMKDQDDACETEQIVDCDVGNWVGGECDVECDDSCEHLGNQGVRNDATGADDTALVTGTVTSDPRVHGAECGGIQTITREVIVNNVNNTGADGQTCGIVCPRTQRAKRCNQFKCPVDCGLSEWTGYSSCTAECDGGVRDRTRSLMVKPSNGGMACNSVEEEESCNTMSCYRDCTLAAWTSWSPCSMACGGGWQNRVKHVLIPIRGEGKCPTETSYQRYEKQQCNKHSCNGDEICIAKQDLIVAVDGSGSITEDGYNTLKSFTKTLIGKYQAQYREEIRMRIGLISFGNGELLSDGSVRPAVPISFLTHDFGEANADPNVAGTGLMGLIDGMEYHKGFTNMAQALALGEKMLLIGSDRRSQAQQSVLIISDGLPSFAFQTEELIEQLDDKGIMRYFIIVSSTISDDQMKLMVSWASQPWESNLIHVPGLVQLSADEDMWSQKALTMFCPMALSPHQMVETERREGFMLVADENTCGARGALLSNMVNNAAQCAYLAQGAGVSSFWLGAWFRRGYCYACPVPITETEYSGFLADRINPVCPAGAWNRNPLYDFYAITPVAS